MSKTEKALVGMCLEMCSKKELRWREKNGLLHYFELDNHNPTGRTADPKKVVKQFSRSAAGKEITRPDDLRPSPVLLKTMNYLINEIIPNKDRAFPFIYDFVDNRIQAIRQDITIQMLEDTNIVQIFEKCVKFYILSSYILCEESTEVFDMHLNSKQLTICLEKVFILYTKFRSENFTDFLAIYFAQKVSDSEIFYRTASIFKHCLHETNVNLSINACLAYLQGNFIKFFYLIKSMPLVLSICFYYYFPCVRQNALKVMCKGYTSKNCKLPIEKLCSWLCINDIQYIKNMCNNHCIKIEGSYICFSFLSYQKHDLPPFKKEEIIDSNFDDTLLSILLK